MLSKMVLIDPWFMSWEDTAVISVVVLQNPMDLQQCDIGSSRNETTIPEIKTEPEVSAVPVVSVCTL